MLLDINFIASVAERDIDFVVMEELSVSDEFRDWISARVFGVPLYGESIGAWHSVSDSSLGETDILFVFSSDGGERIAVLIENKISAPPQLTQGERYRLRGTKGVKDGYWEDFRTCVIAPKRYLEANHDKQSYDSEIAYEEVMAFFSSRRFRDPRFAYKANVFREAIERNRRGYQPKYSDEMTAFVAEYYEDFGLSYPSLCMQEPRPRPANSDWIVFAPDVYPKDIFLCHQLFPGRAKLFFQSEGADITSIDNRYGSKLDPQMTLGPAGKSTAISIVVPKIAPLEKKFVEEREKVAVAFDSLRRLDQLVRAVELGQS